MQPVAQAEDPQAISRAVEALRTGSIVALPTDTVYGLAVDPSKPGAVETLFALKERPSDVALPLLVGTRQQVEIVAGPLDGVAEDLAGRYWPGPLTLVVPRRKGFAIDLGGPPSARQTVGVRLPAHPLVLDLCRELGPLAVTSANLHGARPATSAKEIVEGFARGGDAECTGIAVILDAGSCDGTPSTVVECRGGALRCLREGAIPWREIRGNRHRGSGVG